MPAVKTSPKILSQALQTFVSAVTQTSVDPDSIRVTTTRDTVRIEYQPASDVVPDHVATETDMRDMLKLVCLTIGPDCAVLPTPFMFLCRTIMRWGITASLHQGVEPKTEKQLLEQALATVLRAYEQIDPGGIYAAASLPSKRAK